MLPQARRSNVQSAEGRSRNHGCDRGRFWLDWPPRRAFTPLIATPALHLNPGRKRKSRLTLLRDASKVAWRPGMPRHGLLAPCWTNPPSRFVENRIVDF